MLGRALLPCRGCADYFRGFVKLVVAAAQRRLRAEVVMVVRTLSRSLSLSLSLSLSPSLSLSFPLPFLHALPRFDLGDAPRTKHPLKDQRIVRAALGGGFSAR